jgi:hypothetical protein
MPVTVVRSFSSLFVNAELAVGGALPRCVECRPAVSCLPPPSSLAASTAAVPLLGSIVTVTPACTGAAREILGIYLAARSLLGLGSPTAPSLPLCSTR